MKIAIAGAGGVGGYIGAKLIKAHTNHQIGFIARGEHLKKIQTQGLKIIEDTQEFKIVPSFATDNPKDLGIFDIVIFCTKSYDLKNVADILKNNIDENTYILPLLNGVDHDLTLKEIFPKSKILNGCVYILSNIKEPGVIRKYADTFYLIFGSRFIKKENLQFLKELFDAADLKNKLTDKIVFETWRKYLFIASFALLTSYYKKPMGWVVENRKEELTEILNEIVSLANKKGIPLNEENIKNVLKQAQNIPFDSKTSMQLDFERGKKSEIEALGGYLVKEAQKLNTKTPLIERIYEKLKA